MDIGDELIYRMRTFSPSERVRVVGIDTRKKTLRYDVEFLDGEKHGVIENIPGGRLRGPWRTVREYDERMAHWERFTKQELERHEEDAVEHVFILLIPKDAATLLWKHTVWTTRILDDEALGGLLGVSVAEVLENVDWYSDGDDKVVSPEGTMRIAEYACHMNPMPVLDAVVEDEKRQREYSTRSRPGDTLDNRPMPYSAEWEYAYYLKEGRPVHELLRAWCGQEAVTLQKRLAVAEAEVHRLDGLLVRALDDLKTHDHSLAADRIERAHIEERITPENAPRTPCPKDDIERNCHGYSQHPRLGPE
ncbi:hypothetical protein QFZ53_002845 [Microbacterium natoriense]|uniref:Uncharacterized protein n=1 Tax=Microbacterium natoriense TaxID=284570 RepID=A0AAW8F0S6_9MICO|nr:hypothetical protein [Microbacterium natoriense]MDQ0648649.1 hypothetical protein [Microbacterium natoriense]